MRHTDPSRQATLRRPKNARTLWRWKAVGCGPYEGEASRKSRVFTTESGEPAFGEEGGESSRGLEGHFATRHDDEEGQGGRGDGKDSRVGAGK